MTLAFISFRTRAGDFIKHTLHEPFEPQTILVSRLGWISVLPWNPLCSPYMTYWQCHLERVFQHGSAPWHQTLDRCTKFTKTFGTLAWLTRKTPFHPQLENNLLVTSKRPLWFCIRKTYLCNCLRSLCLIMVYSVKGVWGQCKHGTQSDLCQVIKAGHRWNLKTLLVISKGGSVAVSSLQAILMTGKALLINAS